MLLYEIFYAYKYTQMIGKGLRIILVAPGDSPHARRWISELELNGVDVYFYDITTKSSRLIGTCKHEFGREDFSNFGLFTTVRKIFGANPILGILLDWFNLRKLMRTLKPDLIHIHWMYSQAAIAASLLTGIPRLVTPWGSDLLTPSYTGLTRKTRIKKLINRTTIRFVALRAHSLSTDAFHFIQFLTKLGVKQDKIKFINFGIDIEYFSPTFRNKKFWLSYQIPPDSTVILSNRGLADMYHIPVLFRAVKSIMAKNPDVFLAVVSDGPDYEKLKQMAIDMGISGQTRFLGRLSDSQFRTSISSADIYVSTSPTDAGLAASVWEAMSCGIPVIVSDFGDNPYWINKHKTGLVFRKDNENELRDKIDILLSSKLQRNKMGNAGRNLAANYNNSQVVTQEIISWYNLMSIS